MRNITCLVIVFIIFSSCGGREKEEIDALNITLQHALISVSNNNTEVYNKLEEQLHTPRTREQALIWHPKAMIVREETNSFCNLLDIIRNAKTIKWNTINNKLVIHKNKITEISREVFGNDSLLIQSIDSSLEITSINNYTNLSPQLQKSVLNRKIFDLRNLENTVIKNCMYKSIPFCGLGMTKTSFLVGQSSTHLKKGDVLTISAGMGEFSEYSRPKISINNKKIEVTRGQGSYSIKMNEEFGKKTIPVKVEYTDENGESRVMTQIVEYSIDK